MADNLIHEGDQFAVVSTGPSSIALGVTTDHGLLRSTAERILGDGFDSSDLIQNFPPMPGFTPELMVRAGVAFTTIRKVVESLEQVQHLRKVVVYFSSGYDLNPFLAERRDYHGDGDADPWLRFRGLARPERQNAGMRGPDALEATGSSRCGSTSSPTPRTGRTPRSTPSTPAAWSPRGRAPGTSC